MQNQFFTIIFCIFILFWAAPGLGQELKLNANELDGQHITLKHHQNDFIVEYVGIHFDQPQNIRYQYKMEGMHHDWVDVGGERIARFIDLRPGQYTFSVKAANADGVWSKPISMQIKILDPWWWTWQAQLSYLGLILWGLYTTWNYQLHRNLERHQFYSPHEDHN